MHAQTVMGKYILFTVGPQAKKKIFIPNVSRNERQQSHRSKDEKQNSSVDLALLSSV